MKNNVFETLKKLSANYKRALTVLGLFYLLIQGCKNDNSENNYLNYLTDSISIRTDLLNSDFFSRYSNLIKFIEDKRTNEKYFCFFDEGHLMLVWYNLNKGVVEKKQNIKVDLLRGNVVDYKIVNKDSVYFLMSSKEINMFDSIGNMVDSWNIDDSIVSYGTEYTISTYYSAPLEILDTLAIVSFYPKFVLNSDENFRRYYSANHELIISLKNNISKVIDYAGKYPIEYLDARWYVFRPYRALNENSQLIYSFENKNEITIYNIKSKIYSLANVQSKYYKANPPVPDNKISDREYIDRYYTENFRYLPIHYDKFRKKYYRIAVHTGKYENNDGTINKFYDKLWSIIVCNDKFEVLKEIDFPAKEYDFYNIFVNSNGLMIAPHKLKAPRESEIKYYIFKF